MSSDIFEKYAEIMEENGLITIEAEDKANPRYDSRSIKDIEMLYEVKPNGEEKHIMEQAHPESVYVAPAYDRVNGLVENEIERHNIMVELALKPNNGKLINERYVKAHNELLTELTKTAFLLDRKDEIELMKLADNCTTRLVKTAWIPLVIGLVAATPVVIGLINSLTDSVDYSAGIEEDIKDALQELNNVVDEQPEAGADLANTITFLSDLSGQAARAYSTKMSLNKILKSVFEDKNEKLSKNLLAAKYDKSVEGFFTGYLKVLDKALNLVPISIKDLQTAMARYDGGGLLWKAYRWVNPSDFSNAINSLQKVVKSVEIEIQAVMKHLDEYEDLKNNIDNAKKQIQNKDPLSEDLKDPANDNAKESKRPSQDEQLNKLLGLTG